ncbi:hypothetical protein R7042_09900 [Vibrio sp. 1262-1]|uniref:capsular polysaccharide export protein, LipB/KpsS family n=1 Tax=Vibrio sp. 1262-1 TaxID=3074548 RepID=UPI0029651C3D|nr:hypothetical protein [Vibrio sp. 1262-1]MDW2402512.1 hypothetical protein [Vibrio sp. 1262-1]
MSEKVSTSLFFVPYSFMSPHIDVSLAYIQAEIDKGSRVILLVCKGGKSLSCGFNLYGAKSKCIYCIRRNKDALGALAGDYQIVEVDSANSPQLPAEICVAIDNAKELHEIKALSYCEQDLGYAIVSSLVSRFRTTSLDESKRKVLKQLANAFISVYHSTENIINAEKIDQAFVFNGRLEMTRGFFRACRVNDIDCNILEVSQVGCQSMKYKNAMPLDLAYTKNLIDQLWDSANESQRQKAQEFYEKKANGVAIHDKIYTSGQVGGMLPQGWNNTVKNIVVFGSSADEFYAIGPDWEFPFYKNQYDGLEQIVRALADEENIHIYFRMHPNLSMLKDAELTKEYMLGDLYSNLTVIAPHNKISTYSLMDVADKIVTFGSSVGIEAAYWGKTSILAGNSMYAHLDGITCPASHADLIEAIKNEEHRDISRAGALMYSNFLLTRGESVAGLAVTSSGVTYKTKPQSNEYFTERLLFKLMCFIENARDWNTFAQSIRDRVPNNIKGTLCNFVQRK